MGGWGPSLQEHLLGVKAEELGKERQRDERREEASDRMHNRNSLTKKMG